MAAMLAKTTTILDLNDDCLIEVFQYLNILDLFVWRGVNSRFIVPTEICFEQNFANEIFDASEWHQIRPVIEYFGHFMKNVLVDEQFMDSLKSESITESFLSENMANIERITIDTDIAKEDIALITVWKQVTDLCGNFCFENFGDVHWPHLTTLSVGYYYVEIENYIAFLRSHTNIKKLNWKGFSDLDTDEQDPIIDIIVNGLPNLVHLKTGGFAHNPKASLIFGLPNLETLAMEVDKDVEPFKNLTKLKYLDIPNTISIQNLYDLVEFVPTLRRIKVSGEFSTVFDKAAADGLVAKRMLSPYCETERLELRGHICSQAYIFANELFKKLESKYVSCHYVLCDGAVSTEVLFQQAFERQFNELIELAALF